jgi:hypothetical protein
MLSNGEELRKYREDVDKERNQKILKKATKLCPGCGASIN